MQIQTERDFVRAPWIAILMWVLPIAVLILSGFFAMSTPIRAAIWTLGLGTMGLGCIANAIRCGRIHCYFTGPFLLIMAVVAALIGAGVLAAFAESWNILGAIVAVGAVLLIYVPEALFGRYTRR